MTKPIPLLEKIGKEGRVWGDLCDQYGVDNPDPPWRVLLESTCEVLNEGSCVLPSLARRDEEDDLIRTTNTFHTLNGSCWHLLTQ